MRRHILHLCKLFPRGAIVVYLFWVTACTGNPQLDVSDLVKKAADYNGQMVVVSGCFFKDFEMFVIGPCVSPNTEDMVWITPYAEVEEHAKYIADFAKGLRKREGTLSENDKRMETIFDQIPPRVPTKVMLEGEFKFSSTPQYGNNRKSKYGFILHRVLGVSQK
jgi:hypothetical protein